MNRKIIALISLLLLGACNPSEEIPQPEPPLACADASWATRVDGLELSREGANLIVAAIRNSNAIIPSCIAVIQEKGYPVLSKPPNGGGLTREKVEDHLVSMLDGMSYHPFLDETRIRQLARDFIEANKPAVRFSFRGFDTHDAFRILEESRHQEWLESGAEEFWQSFHAYYPTELAFWQFSAPGFDTNGQFALIYSGMQCSPICGEGMLALLERMDIGNGELFWGVIARRSLWIS